jgi:hypothetical protein
MMASGSGAGRVGTSGQGNTSVGAKIELLKLFGLTLGDVINLNRLAMQAADISQTQSGEFKIGASVLTVNGNMYQGANLDAPLSSAYGSALTAEDCAIFKAMSDGYQDFKAIAVHVKHLIKEDHSHNSNAAATPL